MIYSPSYLIYLPTAGIPAQQMIFQHVAIWQKYNTTVPLSLIYSSWGDHVRITASLKVCIHLTG